MSFEATGSSPLPAAAKQHFQNVFADQATSSYLLLSLGMGCVALLLPAGLIVADPAPRHLSISSYYYGSDAARNLLVGGLWATGVFLALFHGLSSKENWLLNAAGAFGIGVAMFPMPQILADGTVVGSRLHYPCAVLFFICLAIVAVGFAKGRLAAIPDLRVRRRFQRAYDAAGTAMIAMPAAVFAIHLFDRTGCAGDWIFWIETLGIWAFSAFWFVKTYEYRLLLGVTLVA